MLEAPRIIKSLLWENQHWKRSERNRFRITKIRCSWKYERESFGYGQLETKTFGWFQFQRYGCLRLNTRSLSSWVVDSWRINWRKSVFGWTWRIIHTRRYFTRFESKEKSRLKMSWALQNWCWRICCLARYQIKN